MGSWLECVMILQSTILPIRCYCISYVRYLIMKQFIVIEAKNYFSPKEDQHFKMNVSFWYKFTR